MALATALAGTHVDPSVIASTTGVLAGNADDTQTDLLPTNNLVSSR